MINILTTDRMGISFVDKVVIKMDTEAAGLLKYYTEVKTSSQFNHFNVLYANFGVDIY